MKLVIAIVSNDDSSRVANRVGESRLQVTRLATTGGFLLSGNTTFLCGTDAEKVDEVIRIVSEHSKERTSWRLPPLPMGSAYTAFPWRCRWAAPRCLLWTSNVLLKSDG